MGRGIEEDMIRLSRKVMGRLRYHYEHEPIELIRFVTDQGIPEKSAQELLEWQRRGKRTRIKAYTTDEGEIYIKGVPSRKNRRLQKSDLDSKGESLETKEKETEYQKWEEKRDQSAAGMDGKTGLDGKSGTLMKKPRKASAIYRMRRQARPKKACAKARGSRY